MTAILVHSSSRGLGTPEVKMRRSQFVRTQATKCRRATNRYVREEEEQLPDRPEPAQFARDWSLKQTKSNTRPGRI